MSGGNLVYGAFMMTAILFVLVERDVFILRRLILLVVAVDLFNILLSLLITSTYSVPATLNPYETPTALFENSIPLIMLGGILIILELGIMLYIFELIKRFTLSPIMVRASYLITFVAILCFDGIAFPLIAFGTSETVVGIGVGGLSGKLLTAASYSLVVLVFSIVFPRRFADYLNESVFTWRTLLFTSSKMIGDLKRKEAQLTKTQSQIAHSAELAGLGYAISSAKTGQVVECDDIYAAMHGMTVSEFTSLDIASGIIAKLIHDDDRQKGMEVRARVLEGDPVISELRHVLPNGEVRTLRKIFSPLDPSDPENGLYEVVGQDVTETKQLQEKLFQSQKVDAIGKLTGGVAHDFNNLLAVTLGNLELLSDEVTDPGQKALIKNSINATLRGADLTRNMLSFARQAPLEPASVDLNQLVENMKTWIGRTLPSTIKVETSFHPGLWRTEVDTSSAEAALLNLLLNARDAMPGGGKLTIATSNVAVNVDCSKSQGADQDCVALQEEDVTPGRYVLLEVTDTGQGISPEHLKNIFEPFFTTKPVGSGSGLGLSMLEGFMQQSGGAVRLISELNVGTTFRLYFAAKSTIPEKPLTTAGVVLSDKADDRATVLLVEDNAEVLAAFETILTKSGYRVLQASTGDDAFEIFRNDPKIDVLVTDIVMPGELQGTSLAKALRELQPELPVVFMSGYANEATVQGNHIRPNDIRLVKPIQRDNMLNSIKKALLQAADPGQS